MRGWRKATGMLKLRAATRLTCRMKRYALANKQHSVISLSPIALHGKATAYLLCGERNILLSDPRIKRKVNKSHYPRARKQRGVKLNNTKGDVFSIQRFDDRSRLPMAKQAR